MSPEVSDTTRMRARGSLGKLIFGFFPSAAVHVAAELRLADLLADGQPKPATELATATSTHEPSLYRLLRALAYLGVLDEVPPDRFRLTAVGECLRSDTPDSMWALARLFGGEGVWRSWGELLYSVRTGAPAYDHIFGHDGFDESARDVDSTTLFNRAMSEGTRQVAPAVASAYDFTRFRMLVDVGGGDGTLLAAILAANPDLHGLLFDMPAGLAGATERLGAAGVADRCEIVAGDFFDAVPEGADGYILKSVIHDWDDQRSGIILSNCRNAMASDGRALVVEPVLPPTVQRSAELTGVIMSDLNMLVCVGGRERAEADFVELFDIAGFGLGPIRSLPPTNYRLLEGLPQ